MEYTKTSCKIDPDSAENREILVAELGEIGYESFTETDELVDAYIITPDFSEKSLENLFPANYPCFQVTFSFEAIPDQNWNEVWEKNYFQPLLVADRCLIRAPFHVDYPAAEFEIIIDPGMAFGTGNHETTSLMITEILNENLIGKKILDMGCGTGILTILASKMGAERVTAIDIDSWAFNSSVENTKSNSVSNADIILGGAEVIPDQKFDFIYANIQRNILLKDMASYANVLNKGGELIMSGFYRNDLESIKEKATELGLQFIRVTENATWVAAAFTSK